MNQKKIDAARSRQLRKLGRSLGPTPTCIEDQQGSLEAHLVVSATIFFAMNHLPNEPTMFAELADVQQTAMENWLAEWRKRN